MAAEVKIESPLWWVQRLFTSLHERQTALKLYDDYYSGNHHLPWLPEQAQDEFRRVLKMSRSNYMGLVCDAQVERMAVEGFRVGDADIADEDTWALWQRNNMDAEFDKCLLEAAINGMAYLLVTPADEDEDEDEAHLFVEHPSQCIVDHVPGSNRRKRAAGMKAWTDDWTGDVFATVYLPDEIVKFRTKQKEVATAPGSKIIGAQYDWTLRVGAAAREDGDSDAEARNPFGEVPLFEIPNNPRLLTGGVSELVDLIDIQDRVNKTIADRLITQDYGAFPQKWATGMPETKEDGTPSDPIRIGRDRMVATDAIETKFGQFQGTSLDPYSTAKREDVKDIASRSRTPAQYLLGELSNVNGETLKASESGLVSKVKQRMRGVSDPLEQSMRLLRRAAGKPEAPGATGMETLWRNPEFRTEGELVDALVKLAQIHVPDLGLWEIYGATPRQIKRWLDQQKEQAKRNDILAMMADRYRTEQGTGTPKDTSRGSTGNINGSGVQKEARDADGDGTVNERSNRDAA